MALELELRLDRSPVEFEIQFNSRPGVKIEVRKPSVNKSNYIVGTPGPSGSVYGWVVLSDSEHTPENPQVFPSGVRTLLKNDGLGGGPDFLQGAFSTHEFLNADRLRSLGIGDTYSLRLSMVVESTLMNNEVGVELDIAGTVGRIQGGDPVLPRSAGVEKNVEMIFKMYALDTFKSNGGGFYVTPLSELKIHSVSWFISPEFKA